MEALISHVLDAPLTNLCVLAGLAFLGVAIVGNISGKIQPGTYGRLAAGALGSLLLLYGIANHASSDLHAQTLKGDSHRAQAREDTHNFTPMQFDTDLFGGDFIGFNGSTPELCEIDCKSNGKCRAWTYVKAGVQGPQPRCYLKEVIPAAAANACCISGHQKSAIDRK